MVASRKISGHEILHREGRSNSLHGTCAHSCQKYAPISKINFAENWMHGGLLAYHEQGCTQVHHGEYMLEERKLHCAQLHYTLQDVTNFTKVDKSNGRIYDYQCYAKKDE